MAETITTFNDVAPTGGGDATLDNTETVTVTAPTVKIKADEISLEGHVTANENFKIDTSGNMEASGGKIGGWTITSTGLSSQNNNLVLGYESEALGGSSGTTVKYTYGTLKSYLVSETNGKITTTEVFHLDGRGVKLKSENVTLTDLGNSTLKERLATGYLTDDTAAADGNKYTKLLNLYKSLPANGIFTFLSNPAHSLSIGLTNNNWFLQFLKYNNNTGIILAFSMKASLPPIKRASVWNGSILLEWTDV